MGWDYSRIERDWLAGGTLAFPPEVIVGAFDRAERMLGPEWVDNSRAGESGALPTLRVVSMGLKLASIEDLHDTQHLIDSLRRDDASTVSELTAIHLLRHRFPFETELYPHVSVGTRGTVPDFRIQGKEGTWVYVEVAQATTSDAQRRAGEIMDRLISPVVRVEKSFTIEVFLLREPEDPELDILEEKVAELCRSNEPQETLVPGLAHLLPTQAIPGHVVPSNLGEGEQTIRLFQAKVVSGGGRPSRHLVVSMPFSDERAQRFLQHEARQLPTEAPGLVMLDTTSTPISLRKWEATLKNQLQPTRHTRVSAVALFHSSGALTTSAGTLGLTGRFLANQHARYELPPSLSTALLDALAGGL